MIEQDYLMRMIKYIARLLAKLILHRDIVSVELPNENIHTDGQLFYQKLISLADNGQINEAFDNSEVL